MIPVVAEVAPEGPLELCCFCWEPTACWTELKTRNDNDQVACCSGCAGKWRIRDVPTKSYWFLTSAAVGAARGRPGAAASFACRVERGQ